MDAIQFLREKKILSADKTQWIVKFEDGKEIDLVELFEEFYQIGYSQASETIGWDRH